MAANAQMSDVKADDAVVASQVRAAGSSFYWAMRLQPPNKRAGLFAVYAFCRIVDDIADGDAGVADPQRALERWVLRVEALYDGKAEDALGRALVRAVHEFKLRQSDFLSIIEGMMMDANGPVLRPDWPTLTHYCDCVASAVGRLCIRIFGDSSDHARALADHQGQALQLTNILRDIEEDAERGRIYVPQEILADVQANDMSPTALASSAVLPAIRAQIGAAALQRCEAAEAAAHACDAVAIRPAMMMMDAYRQTFDDWAAAGWHRPKSSPVIKLRRRADLMMKAAKLWLVPSQ